jgi:hypothetical protein
MEEMDGGTLVARKRALMEALVDGELVGLEVESSEFYGFNGPATRIWQLIETPATLDAICATLVGEFAVDLATCRAMTADLLRDLARDDMVTLTQPER